jgi:Carboxypeptidase regulatory-like domain
MLGHRYLILGALTGALVAPCLWAQATFGTITGTITDPTGGAVPKATVTVTNQGTGLIKTVLSDSRGEYEVTHLNFGTYTVTAEAVGFTKFEHHDLVLESQQTARIDVRLALSTAQSSVTVSAGTPVVETDSPTISNVKTAHQLRDLPLNTLNTVLLNDFLFFTPTGYQSVGSKFDMGGARATQLYYNVDGISANSPAFGVQNSPAEPSVESIAEMKFNLVDNKAEYSLVTNVTVITKSGQNDFHGRLFEQNTNTALTARSFFASSVGQNIINDFGASVGGPVRHNKTFFFGTYEGFRQRIPAILAPSLPTALMRTGNFSELLGARPTIITNPLNGEPFPGNIIPQSMLDSAALKWQQQFFPLPNFGAPSLTVANFRATFPQQTTQDKVDARVDHYFSPRHTVYGRFSYTRIHPHALDSGVPPEFSGYRVNTRKGLLAALSDTWSATSSLVNEFKLGFTRGSNPREGELSGQTIVDNLGIQGIPKQPLSVHNIPTVSISNFQTIVQVAAENPTENTFQALDQLTYIRGGHTLKTGAEYRPQQSNDFVYPSFGSYTFSNRFTGYSYSDFLLGLPQSTSLTYQRPSTATRYWYLSTFVQDDWKVSPRLTLSYGLRYEYDKAPVDAFDAVSNFDPRTGSIVVPTQQVLQQKVNPLFPSQIPIITAAQAGFPSRPLRNASTLDFQPRFGFAYRPFSNNKTVLRGGYGIYYDSLGGDLFSLMSGGPFGLTVAYTNNIAAGQPLLTFERPFLGTGATGAVNLNATTLNMVDPRVQQMNFTVERELMENLGLRVSFIRTLSTRLLYATNINQPQASTIPFNQNRRPYPLYNNILLYQNGGTQSYNALSTTVNRHFSKGLEFEGAWTWAKNLTDADEFGRTQGGPTIENTYNRVRQRGDAQYAPRHRIFGTAIWQIPAGKGRRWLDRGGVSDWVFGGWQLSATYDWQTGDFMTPSFTGSDPSNTNTIGGIPDRIADGNLPADQRTLARWFNGAAFVAPPNGRFGNSGTGILIGPNRQAGNLGLFKSFHPTERIAVRVQGTFTNVLNHPNFNDPNLNISAPASVGTITSVQTRDYAGARAGLLAVFLSF